jgi:hypothetical protein
MTQLHAIHHGIDAIRPTNDVDIVLHVESTRGVADQAAAALESLGYVLKPSADARNNTAHRFTRSGSTVDIVAGDVVDVLIADHAAPRVRERLRGRDMVTIEGGTQALRRTINARLEIVPECTTTVSVPSVLGALVLKAAAHQTDTRDRERHLHDAVVLLAAIEDPFATRAGFAGSDGARLRRLAGQLPANAREWRRLPAESRAAAQAAMRVLSGSDARRII